MPHPDQIPLGQKLAYAAGMFVNNLQAAALPALLVILNLGLGMDPRWVGWIIFVPRIFDAASDPILGYISDNTRSRWGRRRPYIFLGAILSGLVFAAMWQFPAGLALDIYFWFFMAMACGYFVIYTLYSTPFVALGFEMTTDYHERTRLQAVANAAGLVPWLITPWFYKIMTTDALFANKVRGASVLALVVGFVMCVLGLVPAIFCRENPALSRLPRDSEPARTDHNSVWRHGKNFIASIGTALQCRPFSKLCAATFLVFNGYQFGISFTLYAIQYYLFGGEELPASELLVSYGTVTALCTFGVIPIATWLSTRVGKRRAFFITISISLVGYIIKWFGYDPQHPQWLLASCPFVAFGIGSLFTLVSSMVADVCDYDELENHQRREGQFAAIYWWMVKLGMALAGLLFGYALSYTGFQVALGGAQSEQTLLLLRVFDVAIPLITSTLAIAIMATYPITETRALQIRQELERQKNGTTTGALSC